MMCLVCIREEALAREESKKKTNLQASIVVTEAITIFNGNAYCQAHLDGKDPVFTFIRKHGHWPSGALNGTP